MNTYNVIVVENDYDDSKLVGSITTTSCINDKTKAMNYALALAKKHAKEQKYYTRRNCHYYIDEICKLIDTYEKNLNNNIYLPSYNFKSWYDYTLASFQYMPSGQTRINISEYNNADIKNKINMFKVSIADLLSNDDSDIDNMKMCKNYTWSHNEPSMDEFYYQISVTDGCVLNLNSPDGIIFQTTTSSYGVDDDDEDEDDE